ncbi:hypothetical protein J1779_03685 [Rahnella sp. FC061912-K]|uniref:hypothetical protein n=1 Tax=Rahnella rivi TaxID=2816249 RepID=UPI001C27CB02|nr:hypothetical protein [Rahnella rivi]MBU9829027.1 hypothetical protein [Rahnella rivi]
MTTYWHMQMHPDDQSFANAHIYSILESKKIIGLGEWDEGKSTISSFNNDMKVNDIVAIKNGSKLIALVQVIGGSYSVHDDSSEIGWIEHRRPIRVLDWEIWGKTLPQPRGTLEKCVNEVETTRIIREWHTRIAEVLTKRGIATSV